MNIRPSSDGAWPIRRPSSRFRVRPQNAPSGHHTPEQVAYLATDARRAEAFARLAADVGLTPDAVAGADLASLTAIARMGGGTAAADRAGRMRASARKVLMQ